MKGVAIYLSLFILSILVTVAFAGCGVKLKNPCAFTYEMPSGAICKSQSGLGDVKGFADCTDGKNYVNPEWYRQIKGEGCYEKNN